MSQESQKFFSFEALLKSTMKVCELEKILIQSDERNRKLFTEKRKAILQNTFKKLRCNTFKFSYIADNIAVVTTQAHM